jgi:glycosyltransferase involved in cell wall biosynthesis
MKDYIGEIMHIMYLHQYFITRSQVGGIRSYEFARHFVEQGHKVTMLTVTYKHSAWKGGALRHNWQVDGIDVVELRAGRPGRAHGTKVPYPTRIARFLQFALASSAVVTRLPRPDVVFATSTPLTIGIPGLVASKFHRAPLVFEVRDLWPEAPIQMGALRNPVVIALARWFERTIYRHSARVIALSPGMRDGVVEAGMPPAQVSMIPNASDLDLFSPELDGTEFRTRLGIGERFMCIYFGAMGEANDLIQVVEAARLLQEQGESGLVFVLHGDGKRRPELEAFCRRHELTNVIFSDEIPDKRTLAHLVAASDVCMTIYKNVPILYTCSPNKLFDTFAAGRPAIVNSPGWLKELVEEHEAGIFVRPDDAAHLAERVVFLRDHPEIVSAYGQNARRLAEQCFDRKKLAAQLLSVLESVAK